MSDLLQWWLTHKQEPAQAQAMWDSWQAPHRMMLPLALACMPPAHTLYEIGCGAGPNLRLLRHIRPTLLLRGAEPCEGLAAWASEHLGITIDRQTLPEVPLDPQDVILSCYALAYLDEADMLRTLEGLHSAGHRSLILMEPNAGVVGNPPALPENYHEYVGALRETGWVMTWRWPVLPPANSLNAVIIAERGA